MAGNYPPPARGMGAYDYYTMLVSQGVSPYNAYQQTQSIYGPPPSAQQRAKQEAKGQQTAALAQTGGAIAGAVATNYVMNNAGYVMNNAGQWIDSLTGKTATPEIVSVLRRQYPNATPGTTANTSATTPSTTTSTTATTATPEVVSAKTVEVNTPAGKQAVPEEAANNYEFMSGVNWDAVANGALSVLQAYQAYKAYKSGDKLGAGVYGAGAVTSGAAAATYAGVGGSTASTMAAWAPYVGIAAGLYGGYQTAQMIGETAAGSQRTKQAGASGAAAGAAAGAGAGAMYGEGAGPYGMAIGAVIGGAAGLIGSWTGSHKGKAQFMRDQIRGVLKDVNILDQNYQGRLADGSTYDFGKDGSHMKWKEIDKVAAANPNSWNSVVPLTDAIAASYGFVGQKASDISAWYAKAAVSNANNNPLAAIANAQHFARQQGISYDLVKARLDQAMGDKRINQEQYDHYLNGAKQLTVGIKSDPSTIKPINYKKPSIQQIIQAGQNQQPQQ